MWEFLKFALCLIFICSNGILCVCDFFSFIFTGPSMQDISRDELTLLQTGCDKDSILTNNDSAFDRIKLGRTPELETLPASIKLEDTTDAFQWNTTSSLSSNIESNLLYVLIHIILNAFLKKKMVSYIFNTFCIIFFWFH